MHVGINMENRKKPELLAPAGSPAAFYGAVHAGADAVYLAGSRFGARAYAENFTTEQLVECIRYGHLLGRKIYLTVNTLLKEQELEELCDYIQPFYEAGLDAVIVQDFGVLRRLRESFPGLGLHASTQMTLCSSYGAELLRSMGASRIVPARELSLRELREIRQKTDLELETFIHGAMCYCYSGQCLFSSILGGRSGNRGRCAQPCRLPYSVETGKKQVREGYYLSLKDLCTIDHIPALTAAGIDSFKIEGRMKKPEYAAGVTALYKKYIDSWLKLLAEYGEDEAGKYYHVEQEDKDKLSRLYMRSEIHDGYYNKHNGRDMVTLSSPAYSGSDDRLLEELNSRFLSQPQRLPVRMDASFLKGEQARLTLSIGELSVTAKGGRVEEALRQPVTREDLHRRLERLGDSAFLAEEITIVISPDAFYPLGQINELRRQAVLQLEEASLAHRGYPLRKAVSGPTPEGRSNLPETGRFPAARKDTPQPDKAGGFRVLVTTVEQLEELVCRTERYPEQAPSYVYVEGDLPETGGEEVSVLCERLARYCPLFIALPRILRETDNAYLERLTAMAKESGVFSGFLIRSADGLGFLRDREKENRFHLHLDAGVYVWNSQSVLELGDGIDSLCLPFELKLGEQRQLLEQVSRFREKQSDENVFSGVFEKVVYGRLPMMVTANCILRTAEGCTKESGITILRDRLGKEFPVVRNCRHCMNVIYNCVPLSLHGQLTKWEKLARLRLDFTVEGREETARILDAFLGGSGNWPREYTTGHEKRGVE